MTSLARNGPLADLGSLFDADGEDGDKKSSHRSYSFQQRRNKKV
jgi:hypothetical protein